MKITRRQLRILIKESLENDNPTSIEGLMRSKNLQAINTGIDLAAMLGEIPEPEGQRYREATVQKDGRTVHRDKVLLKFYSPEDADVFEKWLKTHIKFEDELTNNDVGEAFYYRNPFGHSPRIKIVIADEYDVPDISDYTITEVYKPGSPADLYDKYGITGGEQAQLDKLTKSEDPDYREQGRELAWDAYEMPIVSDDIFKVIEGMKNVIEAMRLFVNDIPNDMQRRGLTPDKEDDTDEYFYTVWLDTLDDDRYKFSKFKNKAVNLLWSKPNNAPNLRKLRQVVNAGIHEWDDLSLEALGSMGY